ncbi:MAG: 23S rRNA (cytidine2498-2'-O)-methyltransferase [Candidatus Paceibacteria bacterium]|jgi:23S rRNA (cytidine2498-2'-O)-methyltransferase
MTERTAYLAPEGFSKELMDELKDVEQVHGRLVICKGPMQDVVWAENVWRDARRMPVESIGKAARALRDLQRNWALYPVEHHRRSALIQEKLPHVSAKALEFGATAPTAPLGSWTLLDANTLLAATDCTSAFPNGQVRFIEDKETPPTRAYLKLWEALTLLPKRPGPGDLCLDLGSCPGGWTWVLQGLGTRVLSVDKAPLERGIDQLPGVDFRRQSAYALEPEQVGPVDWLFCDIACYPKKLLTLVQRWLEPGLCRHFVCTIKLQGETDAEAIETFRSIEGASVRHLFHNKHELTWVRLGPDPEAPSEA